MKPAIRKRLSALPRLSREHARPDGRCKICGEPCHFFDVVDFNKSCDMALYPFGTSGCAVEYRRCVGCGFAFTHFFDDWTPEDFSQFIYNDDYLKVDEDYVGVRPRAIAEVLRQRLAQHKHARILDYGSGAGILVDEMRRAGFSRIEGYDPFSHPKPPEGRFEIIFCYEVLEHTPDPLSAIADLRRHLAPGGFIIIGTGLQPDNINDLRGNWWYIAPRNGHVSIFTAEALVVAAQKSGLIAAFGDIIALLDLPLAPAWRALIATLCRPRYVLRLAAPALGNHSGWHGVEADEQGRFRWTAENRVRWLLGNSFAAPCTLSATVPARNAIDPSFYAGCRLWLGDRAFPATFGGNQLTALIEAPQLGSVLEIVLETPMPLRPCDFKQTTDDRRLGLAIAV